MKLDMHFHSVASDGFLAKEQLLERATNQNLDFIALTDHDIISYDFREEAEKLWIQSCQSVEISAYNEIHDKSLHLTFYAKEISQDISKILENVVQSKENLVHLQVWRFKSRGFEIDSHEFYAYFEAIGRKRNTLNKFDITHFVFLSEKNRERARELNAGKEILQEAFYLKFLKRWWEEFENFAVQVPQYETSIELCRDFVKRCDGILSIPHANVTFRREGIAEFQKVLPHYIENGWVNALEINACMTKDWVHAILEAKDKYNLYLTFGSDFHKPGIKDGKHGDFWEQNIYISPEKVREEFYKYRDKIVL